MITVRRRRQLLEGENAEEDGEFFYLTFRLLKVRDSLDRVLRGEILGVEDRGWLRWVESLLSKVDNESQYHGRSNYEGVLATSVAPYVWEGLLREVEDPTCPNCDSEYRNEAYRFLRAGGRGEIERGKVEFASRLVQGILGTIRSEFGQPIR